jgi:predicted nuclease with TOPRIM domain
VDILKFISSHRALATLIVANGGVAISILFGAFQFVSTSQQTQDHVDYLSVEVDQMAERLVHVEAQLNELESDLYDYELMVDDLEHRLDELDNFGVIWNEQSQMIMSEHSQFTDIIREIWDAIDQRGIVPAGAGRTYGY